jgi:hypothetical protein
MFIQEFFIYSRHKFFSKYMIWKYFLPFMVCLFIFMVVFTDAQNFLILEGKKMKLFNFEEVQFLYFVWLLVILMSE